MLEHIFGRSKESQLLEKAQRGELAAQLELADFYVKKGKNEQAERWYRVAAIRGSIEAKLALAALVLRSNPQEAGELLVGAVQAEGFHLQRHQISLSPEELSGLVRNYSLPLSPKMIQILLFAWGNLGDESWRWAILRQQIVSTAEVFVEHASLFPADGAIDAVHWLTFYHQHQKWFQEGEFPLDRLQALARIAEAEIKNFLERARPEERPYAEMVMMFSNYNEETAYVFLKWFFEGKISVEERARKQVFQKRIDHFPGLISRMYAEHLDSVSLKVRYELLNLKSDSDFLSHFFEQNQTDARTGEFSFDIARDLVLQSAEVVINCLEHPDGPEFLSSMHRISGASHYSGDFSLGALAARHPKVLDYFLENNLDFGSILGAVTFLSRSHLSLQQARMIAYRAIPARNQNIQVDYLSICLQYPQVFYIIKSRLSEEFCVFFSERNGGFIGNTYKYRCIQDQILQNKQAFFTILKGEALRQMMTYIQGIEVLVFDPKNEILPLLEREDVLYCASRSVPVLERALSEIEFSFEEKISLFCQMLVSLENQEQFWNLVFDALRNAEEILKVVQVHPEGAEGVLARFRVQEVPPDERVQFQVALCSEQAAEVFLTLLEKEEIAAMKLRLSSEELEAVRNIVAISEAHPRLGIFIQASDLDVANWLSEMAKTYPQLAFRCGQVALHLGYTGFAAECFQGVPEDSSDYGAAMRHCGDFVYAQEAEGIETSLPSSEYYGRAAARGDSDAQGLQAVALTGPATGNIDIRALVANSALASGSGVLTENSDRRDAIPANLETR